MTAQVFSIVGLQRKLDTRYMGMRVSDEVVAKVLAISEVAQIARAEERLREYLEAKWQARAKEATKMAVSMAERGKTADKIAGAVRQIMERWPKDVEDVYTSELDTIYRLARAAGLKKVTRATNASLQYDTPNFTEENVAKAKAKVVPKFDLADTAAMAALKKHQVLWVGEFYEKNLSDGIAQTAKDVMVKAGADRAVAGQLMAEKIAADLSHVRTPDGFHGSTKQYFEGLVANAATVGRAHGQMRSFADVGATKYTIVNPGDERTCEVCSHMDGKVFEIKHGLDQMRGELKAKNPDGVRAVHPWLGGKKLKSISPKAGAASPEDAAKLAAAGFALPPFHFRCRCTVDVEEDVGSFEDMEPMTPPTAEAPSEPIAPDGEDFAATPEGKEHAADIGIMHVGKVTERKPTGIGMNASEHVTVESQSGKAKGVWKDVKSEDPTLRKRSITVGTYYKREAMTYELDTMMGEGTVVPPTINRKIDGIAGSFQRFEKGAIDGQEVVYEPIFNDIVKAQADGSIADNESVRRLALLDIVTGNDDRHVRNVMWVPTGKGKGKDAFRVVAIDNGLTFPHGQPYRFFFVGNKMESLGEAALTTLNPYQEKLIAKIDLRKFGQSMAGSGIKKDGVRSALVRAKALQDDPNAIRKTSGLTHRKPQDMVLAFITDSVKSPQKILNKEQLAEVDKIMEEIVKANPKLK